MTLLQPFKASNSADISADIIGKNGRLSVSADIEFFGIGRSLVWGYFGGVISMGLFWFGVISYCSRYYLVDYLLLTQPLLLSY